MALYWHRDGRLTCAAESSPSEGCLYIDDHFHYELAEVHRVIEARAGSVEWSFVTVAPRAQLQTLREGGDERP